MKVNAKLTDFGSSRNLNLLLTNMTFTKGIGTPKYMAPEILDRNKYKKSADIYSYGITLLEVMIWGEAFPKNQFRFAWTIAEFISSGKRPDTIKMMNEELQMVVKMCWDHEPTFRPEIQDVIHRLKTIHNKL